MSQRDFVVADDDPCLDGHFPGEPIVPAVVILDAVIAFASEHNGSEVVAIERCKFLRPLRPGQLCSIEIGEAENGMLRFECSGADKQLLVRGRLQLEETGDAG